MTTIKETRRQHTLTGKRLRRARWLFVLLHRRHLVEGWDLTRMAKAMNDHGLYAMANINANGFGILRMLYKMYRRSGGDLDWNRWWRRERWAWPYRGTSWSRPMPRVRAITRREHRTKVRV